MTKMKLAALLILAILAAASANAITWSGCSQNISTSNAVYTLTGDTSLINRSGTFTCAQGNANVENITINCNDHNINMTPFSASTYQSFFVIANNNYNWQWMNCNFYFDHSTLRSGQSWEGSGSLAIIGNTQAAGASKLADASFNNVTFHLASANASIRGVPVTSNWGLNDSMFTLDTIKIVAGAGSNLYGIYLTTSSLSATYNLKEGYIIKNSNLTNFTAFKKVDSQITANVNNSLVYNNYVNLDSVILSGIKQNVANFNRSKLSGTNIIGGFNIGGNYYYQSNGLGMSQVCSDANADAFCDESPVDACPSSGCNDYLALSSVTYSNPYGCFNLTGDGTVDTSCIFRDTFNYNEPIVNIGWHVRPGYESTQPNSGMLSCGNTPNYFWLPTYPLTASKGAFVVNMSVALCPITGGEFYMSFGSGSTTSFYLSFQDGGSVKVSDPTLGDQTIGTYNTNCSNLDNLQNISVVVHPEYSPKTFTVWVNGTYLGTGQFTQDGQALDGTTWALWQGNILPNYCSWYMDSVSAFLVNPATAAIGNYTCSYDSVSGVETCTNGTIANSTTQMLGKDCFPSESPSDCFRRVKGCLSGENINVCEARVGSGSFFDGLGGWIVGHPFYALLVVMILIGLVMLRMNNPGK